MDNKQYATLLDEIGDLLQVKGANPFKVRAYQRASRVIRGQSRSIEPLIASGEITELDGIGDAIAKKLHEMKETGSCEALEALREELPAGIHELLRLHGLGPKKVQQLYRELDIKDLDTLEKAAKSGEIAEIDGFGEKTQDTILEELERVRSYGGRIPIGRARSIAEEILERLRAADGVERAEIAGSLRRWRETVGDLDFVVAAEDGEAAADAFCDGPEVGEVVARGETKTTIRIYRGPSADLRVVPPESFGAALHHFTGSKDHNIAMRSRARERDLRISEWGVFRIDPETDEETERIGGETEAEIFEAVGLVYVPPELREDRGEIEAAEDDDLPELIELSDMRGDLHMHSTASDGRASIAEMAQAAADRGLDYIAITDHSQALTVANGLDADRLRAQIDEIAEYNDGDPALRVLSGIEVDILDDGSLDMDEDVLEQLDWVVGSVHQKLRMDRDEMTDRILRAVRSGLVSALGHPTGRLIGDRDPYEYDLDAVLDACAELGVAVEVNASPERLDYNAANLREVLRRDDLWVVISTDAHSTGGLDQMAYGVHTARRGWVPRQRVLNALTLDEFLEARRAPQRNSS